MLIFTQTKGSFTAFEGVAYQYLVLPFGLSLASRTFAKYAKAALAPLRARGGGGFTLWWCPRFGSIWVGVSRSFCLQGKRSLPPVLLRNWPRCTLGHGRNSVPMARRAPVCISSSWNDISSSRECVGSISQILVAPWWPPRPLYTEIICLLAVSPWQLPLRRDLFSQAGVEVFHPRLDLWHLHASIWLLRVCHLVC